MRGKMGFFCWLAYGTPVIAMLTCISKCVLGKPLCWYGSYQRVRYTVVEGNGACPGIVDNRQKAKAWK